jgi:hypothetical protein
MSSIHTITADAVISNRGVINAINNNSDMTTIRTLIVDSNEPEITSIHVSGDVFDIPEPIIATTNVNNTNNANNANNVSLNISERNNTVSSNDLAHAFIPINVRSSSAASSKSIPIINNPSLLNIEQPNLLLLSNNTKHPFNTPIITPVNVGANAMTNMITAAAKTSVSSTAKPIPIPNLSLKTSVNNTKCDTNTITSHRRVKKRIIKINDDEEIKDTRIDYDDDDEEIKKIKNSLFNFVKDIAFNLILTIPYLRSKLKPILNNPSLAYNEIEKQFEDFKDELNSTELGNIKKYVCVEGIRDKLNYILDISFKKIMEDGRIDINDAPQFIQLVYFIIHAFNEINDGEIYKFPVSKEHVMLLLHFILKSVFCLTLDGEEEVMAVGLLDTSFKLVRIEVCPLAARKWYDVFRKFFGCFRKKKSLEDIQ